MGLELLVEGVIQVLPIAGALVVIVAALNGLAVMYAYVLIFTGRPHSSTIDLRIRPSERIAVLILTAMILIGGVFPQRGVDTRYRAALSLAAPRDDRGQTQPGRAREPGPTIERTIAHGPGPF